MNFNLNNLNRAGRNSHPPLFLRTVRLLFVLVVLVSSCSWQWHPDNRIRIKPVIENRLSKEEYDELRLYVMWRLSEQRRLKEME